MPIIIKIKKHCFLIETRMSIKDDWHNVVIIEPYLQSNSADFLLSMVMSECCIALLPEFMVKPALIKQELVECLPEYKVADSVLYAIYPDKNFIPLRVKVFIEQLKTYLAEI